MTGNIIATRGRTKKQESISTTDVVPKTGPKPFAETRHLYYGATYLFDQLSLFNVPFFSFTQALDKFSQTLYDTAKERQGSRISG